MHGSTLSITLQLYIIQTLFKSYIMSTMSVGISVTLWLKFCEHVDISKTIERNE
jgi:hypothetical protein